MTVFLLVLALINFSSTCLENVQSTWTFQVVFIVSYRSLDLHNAYSASDSLKDEYPDGGYCDKKGNGKS